MERLSTDDVEQIVRDTLDLFVGDHPYLRGHRCDVTPPSDDDLPGTICLAIDGECYTLSLTHDGSL